MYTIITSGANHGVFADQFIAAGTVIDTCPVVIIPAADWDVIRTFNFYPSSFFYDINDDCFVCGIPSYMDFAADGTQTCVWRIDRSLKTMDTIARIDINNGDKLTFYWIDVAMENR